MAFLLPKIKQIMSSQTDRRNGITGNLGIKAPCRCATTANITLSGLQTIDVITVVADDRVLVKDQTDTTQNGVYVASSSAWQRATDFDGINDVVDGTMVPVARGTLNANSWWQLIATNPITFGTSTLTFTRNVSGSNTGNVTLSGQNYLSILNQQITAAKITLANMANLAANSFVGNNTGSSATPIALSATQATAALNAVVGDSGSGGIKGLVPAPGVGDAAALKYLKADGTWATTPSASAASTSVQGIVELLTNAELQTGTDTTRAATAASILSLFAASSKTTNGFARLPINSAAAFSEFIIQWGVGVAGTGNKTLVLPMAFPNTFSWVNMYNDSAVAFRNFELNVNSTSSFDYEAVSVGSTNPKWVAIGF